MISVLTHIASRLRRFFYFGADHIAGVHCSLPRVMFSNRLSCARTQCSQNAGLPERNRTQQNAGLPERSLSRLQNALPRARKHARRALRKKVKNAKFLSSGWVRGGGSPPDTIPGSASRAGGARGPLSKLHEAQNAAGTQQERRNLERVFHSH